MDKNHECEKQQSQATNRIIGGGWITKEDMGWFLCVVPQKGTMVVKIKIDYCPFCGTELSIYTYSRALENKKSPTTDPPAEYFCMSNTK